jgi:hypothetical protein
LITAITFPITLRKDLFDTSKLTHCPLTPTLQHIPPIHPKTQPHITKTYKTTDTFPLPNKKSIKKHNAHPNGHSNIFNSTTTTYYCRYTIAISIAKSKKHAQKQSPKIRRIKKQSKESVLAELPNGHRWISRRTRGLI